LHMLVVLINCSLGFLCCHLVVVMFCVASTSQVIGEEEEDGFFAPVRGLAGKIVSEMTHSGTLHPTILYYCCFPSYLMGA